MDEKGREEFSGVDSPEAPEPPGNQQPEVSEVGVEGGESSAPTLMGRRKGSPAKRKRDQEREGLPKLTPEQRLLILDCWDRSKLPATEFAPLVGLSPHTLYGWRKRFTEHGPAGLSTTTKRVTGSSRLPEATKRAILMLKSAHPDWGCERIHLVLLRDAGFTASPNAISRLLKSEGYELSSKPTKPHPPKRQHRFERSRPNQLWQTDLFTFLLRRENRRVYLVVFMDDHSRFITSYGLHASASGSLVRESLECGIANYGAPEEVLTDNGAQYHSWRGKSAFRKLLDRRGIRQIVSRPKHPQTLGKVERFWGTLWRECLQEAVFRGLDDARRRVGLFIDHYNFHRPHQGIEGLVPADRFFSAAPEVKATLAARVSEKADQLARDGLPRKSFYLTGRVGGEGISLHAEGSRVVLTTKDGTREEVDLEAPGRRAGPEESFPVIDAVTPSASPRYLGDPGEGEEPSPGTSPLDGVLEDLEKGGVDGADEQDEGEGRAETSPDGSVGASRQRAGEASGRGSSGKPERSSHADGSRRGTGDVADALLPAGDAGAADADRVAGAAAEGQAEESGAADRGAGEGEEPLGAGAVPVAGTGAQCSAVSGFAADSGSTEGGSEEVQLEKDDEEDAAPPEQPSRDEGAGGSIHAAGKGGE